MNIKSIIRIILSLAVCMTSIFSYVSLQNTVTRLKIQIPKIEKQLLAINDEISHLQFEVDQFESPDRLMDLACHPDFSHLKHPYLKDIEVVSEGFALTLKKEKETNTKIIALPIGKR